MPKCNKCHIFVNTIKYYCPICLSIYPLTNSELLLQEQGIPPRPTEYIPTDNNITVPVYISTNDYILEALHRIRGNQ